MWLSKFLDIEDDLEELRDKIKENIFKEITKKKLTPLEFTILENIFNSKKISGYDLIQNLNKQFAGTWEAKSGTVYPILSKLKKNGFLTVETVKSPIGPLKNLYKLTRAGEEIVKAKVNTNFEDQLNFLRNFLIELSNIYIHSFPEEQMEEKVKEVQNSIEKKLKDVKNAIPQMVKFKTKCPACQVEIKRDGATFCPYCGASLFIPDDKKE